MSLKIGSHQQPSLSRLKSPHLVDDGGRKWLPMEGSINREIMAVFGMEWEGRREEENKTLPGMRKKSADYVEKCSVTVT